MMGSGSPKYQRLCRVRPEGYNREIISWGKDSDGRGGRGEPAPGGGREEKHGPALELFDEKGKVIWSAPR